MIKILGAKRIVLLLCLVGINVLLATSLYMYFIPDRDAKKRELKGHQSKISSLQSDISRMQLEFEQLEKQRAEFEKLKKRGFFHLYDRREAEIVLNKIQKESDVISAAAKISAGARERKGESRPGSVSVPRAARISSALWEST